MSKSSSVFAVIEKAVSILGLCRTANQIKIGLPPLRIYVNARGKTGAVRRGTLALIERFSESFDEKAAIKSMADISRGRPKKKKSTKPAKSKPKKVAKSKPLKKSAKPAKSKTATKSKTARKHAGNGHAKPKANTKKRAPRKPPEAAPVESPPPPVLA
jgi:hypothetical protein